MIRDGRLRAAVCGASGYVGGELVRWLLGHPRVELRAVTASARAGSRLDQVHPQLAGHTDLVLDGRPPRDLAAEADVLFLALPHGEAASAVAALGPDREGLPRLIDLSGDHRLRDPIAYRAAYGRDHPAPELIQEFVYGLPEVYAGAIAAARRIANPGCFATALSLALLPLARAGLLAGPVPAFGLTGSSGSGDKPSPATHHPGRAGNLRVYKALGHQHVPEVEAALRAAGPVSDGFRLDFVPCSAPIVRGILVTAFPTLARPLAAGEALDLYRSAFEADTGVIVVVDRSPEVAAVRGTNRAEIAVHAGGRGALAVSCAIDNLGRGAAGQAIANLDRMMGWPPGLGLHAIAPIP